MKKPRRRQTFYASLPRLTPAMIEALIRRAVEEDAKNAVAIRCRGIGPPRTWWLIDEWGRRRL